MTDEWLAGFFDGEGCISGQCYFSPGKYIKQPKVCIQVSITQKDTSILYEIVKYCGGTVQLKGDKSRASHIRWTGRKDMGEFLRRIAPYSVCKKDQILLALKFIDTLREENLGCEPLSDVIHKERKEIYDGLRLLKKVG